jgi:Tat protein translocase TatB subunit
MSGGEILIIVLVAYLVLGPKKIPEIARMVGKGINDLRRATDDIRHEITREVNNIKKDAIPDLKDPFIPPAYKQDSNPKSEPPTAASEKKENTGTGEEMK